LVIDHYLSHRKTHALPTDEVDVQVVDHLTAVRAGVDDESITCLRYPELFGYFFCSQEEMAGDTFIGFFEVIDRSDVLIRDNEQMVRSDRMGIPKSGDHIIAIIDFTGGFTRDDSAKDTP
jgi:hypothetical protein